MEIKEYDSYLTLFLRIQFGGTCKPTRWVGPFHPSRTVDELCTPEEDEQMFDL